MAKFDRFAYPKLKSRFVRSTLFGKGSKIVPASLQRAIRSNIAISAIECPGVVGRIHFNDDMLPSFSEDAVCAYVRAGLSGLRNIEESVEAGGLTFESIKACLDIPCGYGRVLRWLQTRIDSSRITASDLNREGVDFCCAEFGVKPLYSKVNLSELAFPETYDLIWVGSLLTHLDAERGLELLTALAAALNQKGVLVFTTHGRECLDRPGLAHFYSGTPIIGGPQEHASFERRLLAAFDRDGFCYAPYEEGGLYGNTIHAKEYVEALMKKHFSESLLFLRFAERGWDELQDVWAFQKSEPKVSKSRPPST